MCVRAAKKLHNVLLDSLLRCTMQFFESTPIGRILNRVSKDIEVSETRIPDLFRTFVRSALSVLSVVVVVSITQPYFVLLFLIIAIVYVLIQVLIVRRNEIMKNSATLLSTVLLRGYMETMRGN